jgi:Mlc titration factor MtfA (ptsG expression regulator)
MFILNLREVKNSAAVCGCDSPAREVFCSRHSPNLSLVVRTATHQVYLLAMFGFFTERRRRALRARDFPNDWLALIRHSVQFFDRLPSPDQQELLGHTQVFLAEKRFEGCAGLNMTEEIRLSIAVQACLLLLHRKTDYFPRLVTILVYPSTYLVDESRPVTEHVWEEGAASRLGETGRRMGSMVLAWDAVKAGAADASDGRNVVFHEFAHQLDFEDNSTDGVPELASREQYESWAAVMRVEFAKLRAAADTGIPTLLDTYGASSPAEFFAVAIEAFFERPFALRDRHPRLFAELQRYFQQDPTQYVADALR